MEINSCLKFLISVFVFKRMLFFIDLVCVMNILEVFSECVYIDFYFRDGVLCFIEEERIGLFVGMCVDCVFRGYFFFFRYIYVFFIRE